MLLKKGNKEIHICDWCLTTYEDYTVIIREIRPYLRTLEICNNCLRYCSKNEITINRITQNSITKLRWYMILYQYLKEGYELVSDYKNLKR